MSSVEKDNLIQKKSFDFAKDIIFLYKKLLVQKEFVISKQLLRSGTSVGANIEEVIVGQSRKDLFIRCLLLQKRQEKQDIG